MYPQPESRHVTRVTDGRVVGGVCAGIAQHLGVSVVTVRVVFVVTAFIGAAGLLGYVMCWVLMPVQGSDRRPWGARPLDLQGVLGLMSMAIGVLMALALAGLPVRLSIWVPVLMGIAGVVVLWRQSDDAGAPPVVSPVPEGPLMPIGPDLGGPSSPQPFPGPPGPGRAKAAEVQALPDRAVLVRILVGLALLLVGVLGVIVPRQDLGAFAQAAAALLALLAGLVVIALPWIRAYGRRLQAEQLAAARAEERAAMAARVHDSVLQTLTLIQRRAGDQAEVSRLARSEERALRSWLYAPVGPRGMLADTLAQTVAATEEDYDLRIELVTVGDLPVDERVAAVVAATREALVNAAKHAHGSATMVYVEAADGELEVNVRDRGPGFDPGAVDADRHGIRESIVGRMESVGGQASVRSHPGEGTEVRLRLPLEVADE